MYRIRPQKLRYNDVTQMVIGAQSSGKTTGNAEVEISAAACHSHHKIHGNCRVFSDARQNHVDFRAPHDTLPELETLSTLGNEFSPGAPGGEFGFDGECD